MNNFDRKMILLFVLAFLTTAISISIYNNKILEPTLNNNQVIAEYEKDRKAKLGENQEEEIEIKEQTEAERLLELKSMSETNRIHQYFSEYMKCIDLKNYEKAYEYLYEKFKENYFPDFETFKEYVQKVYPDFMGIQYKDIERQGNDYVLTVYVYDALSKDFDVYVEQKFVIYEKELGEFVLSFQING